MRRRESDGILRAGPELGYGGMIVAYRKGPDPYSLTRFPPFSIKTGLTKD